jgi:(4S)-4-hydroxy-5-phosphonooxypentane-2,3-dione isomerase
MTSTPYVILVEFALHEGQHAAFEQLILENARLSLRDEPGCLVFDVLTREGSEFDVVLYEIYVDRAAFDAHLRAPHFHVFDETSRPLVRKKQVTELSLLSPLPGRDARSG